MTLPLPTMNRICKHWNLPQEFQESCDYYFLRNYSDQDFVSLLQVSSEGSIFIPEYGINFQVLFLGDAAQVYVRNGELAKRNEPNNTFYWCSFRSLTFEFAGRKETKSFVLVQVDKKGGLGEVRDKLETRDCTASREAGAIHPQGPVGFCGEISPRATSSSPLHAAPCGTKEYWDIPSNRTAPRQATAGLSPKEAFWKNGYVSSADAIAEYERIKELGNEGEEA